MRLILLILIFYLTYRLLSLLLRPGTPKTKTDIKGKADSKPLDYSDNDIQDIDYKDINEDNNNH
jgi:hypothetical protein